MSRAAIYYAPQADDPLWQAGTTWLGHDPETGAAIAQPEVTGIEAATASPRRYGFHATLKPPMACAHGLDRLIDDAGRLAKTMKPFAAPRLRVARLDGFIALVEAVRAPALQQLADACVVGLDHHRTPEIAARMARRASGLDAVGLDYLTRYGYPHVLDRWRFHMTLSERLPVAHPIEAAACRFFAAFCATERVISGIAIYVEREPGARFSLLTRIGFGS